MSEKSCNRCVFGQFTGTSACQVCVLKSNFCKAPNGIVVVNPPVHDDRALPQSPCGHTQHWKDLAAK